MEQRLPIQSRLISLAASVSIDQSPFYGEEAIRFPVLAQPSALRVGQAGIVAQGLRAHQVAGLFAVLPAVGQQVSTAKSPAT